MADEITQADIDKAVEAALAKQKADDDAAKNITLGGLKFDKAWLKWFGSVILALAVGAGYITPEMFLRLIGERPATQAPTAEELKPPPPVEVIPAQAPAISQEQIDQLAELLKPFIKPFIDKLIDDLKPKPKPDPKPDPTPQPDPKPQPNPEPAPPTDGIKAVDADGKIHLMDVESGHQFKVIAGQPGLWGYEPKSTWIDVQQYPDHAIVTLRDDPSSPVATEITLAHSTATALSMLRVKCQHAAQPPPDDVKPKPQPAPTQKLSAIQLVYPPNASPVVAKAIGNQPWWDLTYPNAWSFYTSNTANTQARRAISLGATKGVQPPLLALWTGPDTLANVIPLPMTLDELPGRVQEALK